MQLNAFWGAKKAQLFKIYGSICVIFNDYTVPLTPEKLGNYVIL